MEMEGQKCRCRRDDEEIIAVIQHEGKSIWLYGSKGNRLEGMKCKAYFRGRTTWTWCHGKFMEEKNCKRYAVIIHSTKQL